MSAGVRTRYSQFVRMIQILWGGLPWRSPVSLRKAWRIAGDSLRREGRAR